MTHWLDDDLTKHVKEFYAKSRPRKQIMNPETELSKAFAEELKKQFQPFNSEYHLVRIESNYTMQGIPDVYLCVDGKSCWIEMKVGKNKLSPLQIAWITKQRQAGGLVFVVHLVKENHYTISWKKEGECHYTSSLFNVIREIFEQLNNR